MDLYLVIFSLTLCVTIGTGPSLALDCYECNVHLCGRDESGLSESDRRASPECVKFKEAMALTNQTARREALDTINEKHNGTCQPVVRGNCKACIKVDTTASYIGARGVQYQNRVISKVCALEMPKVEKDDCDSRGAKYARSIVCVCYGDNCNTASSLGSGITVLVILVLANLL